MQRGSQLMRRLSATTISRTARFGSSASASGIIIMRRSISTDGSTSMGGESSSRIFPLPGDVTVAPPPKPAQVIDGTQMRAIFLGYGVGQFELELLRGAPQLTDHATNQASVQRGGSAAPVEASSRFDLSYVPPANPTATGGAMKSSWATDKNATSSADPEVQRRAAMRREQQEERQAQAGAAPWETPQAGSKKAGPSGEMGDPDADVPLPVQAVDPEQPDPFAALVAAATPAFPRVPGARPAVQSQAAASAAPATPASGLPSQMRLIVNGSVVVYQNCMYCWSPKVFDDITADSLSFLRVLTPRPELILIGAGAEISSRLRPDVTQLLQELRIGVEVMDSGNAIATYNILTDEGRTVLAAMLQKPEPKVVEYKPSRSELMRRKLGYWQHGQN